MPHLVVHPFVARMEPELRWYRSHVAWRLHHQGESSHPPSKGVPSESPPQSVFLNDIAAAYTKNRDLESLLFDEFFINGTSTTL